ncbi:MAG: hypothetical protein ABEK36_06250 [Candidatus Aenigmatarchaeota archaeon]
MGLIDGLGGEEVGQTSEYSTSLDLAGSIETSEGITSAKSINATGSLVGASADITGDVGTATVTATGLVTGGLFETGGSLVASGVDVLGTATAVDIAATGDLTIVNVSSSGSVVANNKNLSPAGTGSPTTWGKVTQAGTGDTGAGSEVFVSFGTKFGGTPYVAAQTLDGDTGWLYIGSVQAGSFMATSENANATFNWVAVGDEA